VSRQFDVHAVRLSRGRRGPSFLVNLQSDLLNVGPTVVAAPLWSVAARRTQPPASIMMAFADRDYWLVLTDLAYVRVKDLGRAEGNLEHERERIIRGLDLLFTGI
jgi:hypothetical protein